jgi:hypothetical protein
MFCAGVKRHYPDKQIYTEHDSVIHRSVVTDYSSNPAAPAAAQSNSRVSNSPGPGAASVSESVPERAQARVANILSPGPRGPSQLSGEPARGPESGPSSGPRDPNLIRVRRRRVGRHPVYYGNPPAGQGPRPTVSEDRRRSGAARWREPPRARRPLPGGARPPGHGPGTPESRRGPQPCCGRRPVARRHPLSEHGLAGNSHGHCQGSQAEAAAQAAESG